MTPIRNLTLTLVMGLLFPFGTMAHDIETTNLPAKEVESVNPESETERESIFPNNSRSLENSHFTWGAEMGSSIDMTGHDQSTFDADVNFGYKNSLLRLVGLGVGVHRAFGNGNNFVPVYAIFRSSFTRRPSLLFMTMKIGYSFNTIGDADTFGDAMASVGCGINLATGKNFKSHLSLCFGYRYFNQRHQSKIEIDTKNVYLAQINFGVNF